MLTPEELDDYLEVLTDRGVTEYSCEAFTVSLLSRVKDTGESTTSAAIHEGNESAKKPKARGIFAHPSLWPDGTPPSFPKAE